MEFIQLNKIFHAEVVELADASDSKSDVGNNVRVQVPPSAPNKNFDNGQNFYFFGKGLEP